MSKSNPSDEKQRYDTPERVAENFRKWWSAMEISHAMLMAGLRDRVGEGGDVQAAYRQWQQQRREAKRRAYDKAAARYFERLGKKPDATETASKGRQRGRIT